MKRLRSITINRKGVTGESQIIRNNMPFYGIHSFRHFAALALISSGLDVVTVSGALGHCNSGTTLNVYAHMFQTAQARVAQAMDGAFSFLPQDTTT
jgi:integrase